MKKIILTLFTATLFISCSDSKNQNIIEEKLEEVETDSENGLENDFEPMLEVGMVGRILLQPYKDFDKKDVELIENHLVSELPHYSIEILPAIDMPKKNKSVHRDRFRADSIIRDMRRIANVKGADAILALTTKDISTTYKGNADWGVMGLGFRPGKGAVISTFRLNKKNKSEQMLKLATHELGHNLGLDHCPNKTCIMRDAKGKNHFNETKHFCDRCKGIIMDEVYKKWTN